MLTQRDDFGHVSKITYDVHGDFLKALVRI